MGSERNWFNGNAKISQQWTTLNEENVWSKHIKHRPITNDDIFNIVDTRPSFCYTSVVGKCSVSVLLTQAPVCNRSITLLGLIIQTIRSNFHLSRPTKEKELLSETSGRFYLGDGVCFKFIKGMEMWALLILILKHWIIHKCCKHIWYKLCLYALIYRMSQKYVNTPGNILLDKKLRLPGK